MSNFPVSLFVWTLSFAWSFSGGSAWASPGRFLKQKDAWFGSEEGRQVAERVLSWQAPNGAWPKNGDTTAEMFAGDVAALRGTFDNGATREEIRLLARVFAATGDARFREAVLRGIGGILAAQGALGGWPQSFPPGDHYARHITLNDGTMVGLLGLLRDVAEEDHVFGWVDAERRAAATSAVARGVGCLLDCQIIVEGRRTVWCAQHDERNLRPRPARTFELVSLSGGESAGVLVFLMRLGEPDARMIGAIEEGAAWFEKVRILGLREEKRDGDKEMVADPGASPLWARFYEIGTNRPIFAGRDGVKRYRIDEIEYERRNGYSWYHREGEEVAREFAKWQQKWPDRPVAAPPILRDPLAPPLVVAADGSGDFRTVGEAVAAAPNNSPVTVPIYLQPGVYREAVGIPEGKPSLSFIGPGGKKTRLVWGKGEPITEFLSPTLTVEGEGFAAEGLAVENDFGPGIPAPALVVRGDLIHLKDCRVAGWKHTLRCEKGAAWFEDCEISGHLDFLSGAGRALFEGGTLRYRASGAVLPHAGFTFSGVTLKAARGVAIPAAMRERLKNSAPPENEPGDKQRWNPLP